MEILKYVSSKIWSPKFWLPNNHDWSDVSKFNRYSLTYSLYYPVYVAICLIIIRILFEKFIGRPIGKAVKIEDDISRKFVKNPQLEVYYKERTVISESVYMELSRETKMNIDEIRQWFKARKSLNKTSKMKKFTESCWRCVFYFLIWLYGINTLYTKSWMWDTKEYWNNYPKHEMSDDLYWYYTIELGFYLSLLVSQFFDTKRKDFWQMFLHHIVTICLLVFSYVCNFTRVGSFILLLHDCVDPWLELGKLGLYSRSETFSNISFSIFTIVWFITRIVGFPIRVLYSTTVEGPQMVGGIFPAYFVFNILLYILQVMHIMWFYTICRMAYRGLVSGNVGKDDRSESDDNDSQDLNEVSKDK